MYENSYKKEHFMSDFHVSDGKISGGSTGAMVCGILVLILTNIYYFASEAGYSMALKILHLVLSFADIPLAIAGQKIARAIDDVIHGAAGEDAESVYVSRSLSSIIIRKYMGALLGCLVLEGLFLIFNH
jgi:hypothetical protein